MWQRLSSYSLYQYRVCGIIVIILIIVEGCIPAHTFVLTSGSAITGRQMSGTVSWVLPD